MAQLCRTGGWRSVAGVLVRKWPRRAALALGVCALLAGTAVASVAASPSASADTTATINPGATWDDQNGNPLQMHGLGIIKVGSTYYGFGEDKVGENSSSAPFRAIPCYSSTNLGTWTYVNEALTAQSSGDLGPGAVVERPKVIYNSSTGQYVMYMHIDNASYTENRVGMATSSSVCGPYTYQGSFQPLGTPSFDMGLFQDSNGAAYLMSEDNGHGLHIYALSSDYLSVSSLVAVLPDHEAPTMFKANGTYFLLGSSLSGWASNDNQYTTATSLSGPWSSWADFAPTGSDTYNTQVANVITVQGSSGTTYIYAGDRWNTADLGASELIWLPLDVSGSSLSLPWYSSWSIDTSAGTWSALSNAQPLVGAQSGRCLDVPNKSTTAGANLEIWDCNGGGNQQWNLNADGTITGAQSGQCLDVSGQSTSPGARVDIWPCNGQGNQEWTFTSSGTLVGVQSGLCLDETGQASGNGTPAETWTCNGGSNQQWAT
jgi:Ricin-type beta-trefoil lectin domain/Glycosyl hydrolases family 43